MNQTFSTQSFYATLIFGTMLMGVIGCTTTTVEEYCDGAVCEFDGVLNNNEALAETYSAYFEDACCSCVDGYLGSRCHRGISSVFFGAEWTVSSQSMVTGTLPATLRFATIPGDLKSMDLKRVVVDGVEIEIPMTLMTKGTLFGYDATTNPWKDSHVPAMEISGSGTVNGKAWVASGTTYIPYANAIKYYTMASGGEAESVAAAFIDLTITLDGVTVIQTQSSAELARIL